MGVFNLSHMEIRVLTFVGIATLVAYYCGHLARKIKLPSLIGYMIVGVVLGPSILHLMGEESLYELSFITEIALGFVAFTIGAELHLASLRRLGPGIVSIILSESLVAFAVVTLAVYLVTRDLPMALIYGAIAPASAPAGTVAVIHEYKAKGPLTKALYAVVGFDDGLAIIIFGFAAAFARKLLLAEAAGGGENLLPALLLPAKEIVLSVIVGAVIGLAFSQLVRRVSASKDMLIVVFGTVLLGTGLAARWHLSLILTNMVVGFVLVNTRREALVHRVTQPLGEVMPLLFVLFFCLAGAHLQLRALPRLGLVGSVYIVARTVGLIGGARLGATLGHVEPTVKKYVGLGILSQAGVAIGLSLIVSQEFMELGSTYNLDHAYTIGASVITSVTATCIFFEVLGPIMTRYALAKAGEIPNN